MNLLRLRKSRGIHEERPAVVALPEYAERLELFLVIVTLVKQSFEESNDGMIVVVVNQLNISSQLRRQFFIIRIEAKPISLARKLIVKSDCTLRKSQIV